MSAASVMAPRGEVVVADLMSRPVLTVEAHETLWAAWQLLFISGLRHLVVINPDGSSRGVLSDRNILANVPTTADNLSLRTVGEIMSMVPLLSLDPGEPPLSAAKLMVDGAVEAVPVVDGRGHVVGIITETDIVRWLVS